MEEWKRLVEASPLLSATDDENSAAVECSEVSILYDPNEGLLRHDDPRNNVIGVMLELGNALKATVVGYEGEVFRTPDDYVFLNDVGLILARPQGPCVRFLDRVSTTAIIAVSVAAPFVFRGVLGLDSVSAEITTMLVAFLLSVIASVAFFFIADEIDDRFFAEPQQRVTMGRPDRRIA